MPLKEYRPPCPCIGTLCNDTVDVSGELIKNTEAGMRAVMARQQEKT